MSDYGEESQEKQPPPPHQRFPCGTRISKTFTDSEHDGIATAFVGRIKHFELIEDEGWLYFVKYEDGDSEHMTEEEVARCVFAAASAVRQKEKRKKLREERPLHTVNSDDGSIQESQSIESKAKSVTSPVNEQDEEEEFVWEDDDKDEGDMDIVRKPRLEFDQPLQTFPSGTLVTKGFVDPATGKRSKFRGQIRRFELVGGEGWRYFVKYEDGDTEHMTEEEVYEFLAKKSKKQPERMKSLKRKRSKQDDVGGYRYGSNNTVEGGSSRKGSANKGVATQQAGRSPPVLDETTSCFLCKQAPMKKPRVLRNCYHIFCKPCIRKFCEQNGNKCPICNVADVELTRELNHDGFKPVEALNTRNGEVVHSFDSASTASIKLGSVKGRAFRVVHACRSKARDEKEFAGFLWRFRGSKERILCRGEAIKDGFAVEQVCLETGNVINVFPSYRNAEEKTGVGRGTIQRVVSRKGKANGVGFFWRLEGETHGPWPDPEPSGETAVEKLCLQTGKVLEEFRSLAEAKLSMGMKGNSSCIRECCNGIRISARGFYWRWRGTDKMPDLQSKHGKIVILRRSKKGRICKEFPTATHAGKSLGMDTSTIARWCREESFNLEYWWSYADQDDGIPDGERVVGKRLRLSEDGSWIDGTVVGYKHKSGKHVVEFDGGETRKLDLSVISYEWKNDQGQKAVEKLDLETGEVLETYESIIAAQTEGNPTNIIACAKGTLRSAGGYFWRYKGSTAMPRKPKPCPKVVEQICLKTGKVLETYKTIAAAGRAVGITSPGISYCCNGRHRAKSAGGFGWRFRVIKEEGTLIKQEADT